ncbi:Probable RNA-directed DNA polymerase from transposon X-element [Eumeta japonica]|uniref:Probable RNA-directed DNA polymerase from transposon X-element n=1 Tax=Eumeta variegata TaxID=151549 RepID=A0A4C1W0A8_EUMVA|nr:Probable RNA-directed DNA polymerase from transposon X-element [Eumeta japonica]
MPRNEKRLNHKIKELKRILNNDRNKTGWQLGRSDHERVDAFAEHLTNVFKPHPYEGPPEHEKMVMECSREAAAESTMPKNTQQKRILSHIDRLAFSPSHRKYTSRCCCYAYYHWWNNIKLPDHQFGFRRKHATVDQIHRLINEIDKSFESKEYCASVFLDISQAFDRVWHEGLLFKIKSSLPNYICQILESFIQNRRFVVQHGEALSRLCDINAGVPQGSVLGPLLYLIYTSDLPTSDCITTGTFADDTAILASHQDPAEASKILQDGLNNILNWLKRWRIKVNESKSVSVIFTLKKGICPRLKINNIEIPQADHARYLGLHLDKRLTWQKHIFTKRKQLGLQTRKLYWLMGRQSQLSLSSKLILYKAILKPVWTYGIQLWGTASHSNVEIVQRFQNKMLRMVTNAPLVRHKRTVASRPATHSRNKRADEPLESKCPSPPTDTCNPRRVTTVSREVARTSSPSVLTWCESRAADDRYRRCGVNVRPTTYLNILSKRCSERFQIESLESAAYMIEIRRPHRVDSPKRHCRIGDEDRQHLPKPYRPEWELRDTTFSNRTMKTGR